MNDCPSVARVSRNGANYSIACTAMSVVADDSTDMTELPNDLIDVLMRRLGSEQALKLSQSSNLHSAWQAAVEAVALDAPLLDDVDIRALSKLSNLQSLTFRGTDSPDAPVWHVLASVAPSLTRLRHLGIDSNAYAPYALREIAGCSDLDRLEELDYTNVDILTGGDLLALSSRQVSKLQIEVGSLDTDSPADKLSAISKKLSSLQYLALSTDELPTEPQITAFPGALDMLRSLSLSLIQTPTGEEEDAEEEAIILTAAISGLTSLCDLSTNYTLSPTPAEQLLTFAQLVHLTSLHLAYSYHLGSSLHVLDQLPNLAVLNAPLYTITDPFRHPSLCHVVVWKLEASEGWRGKTADESSIEHLAICHADGVRFLIRDKDSQDAINDSHLDALPFLPDLVTFKANLCSDSKRFPGLADLLHRQHSTLRSIHLNLGHALEEGLPRELSACTSFSLCGFGVRAAVSRVTMQLLSMCSMPALQEVVLGMGVILAEMSARDHAWVCKLPALERFNLKAYVEPGSVGAGPVREWQEGLGAAGDVAQHGGVQQSRSRPWGQGLAGGEWRKVCKLVWLLGVDSMHDGAVVGSLTNCLALIMARGRLGRASSGPGRVHSV